MGRPKCLEYYVTVRVRYKKSSSIKEQYVVIVMIEKLVACVSQPDALCVCVCVS